MTTRAKRRLAVAALVVLGVWPAIHFGLYRQYAIEPWKLCGWAMYARPRSTQQVALMELHDGHLRPIHQISAPAREELARLSARRGALGALQPMDSLGAMLLEERPTGDGVRIVVRNIAFDCRSGRLDAIDDATYDYLR